MTWKVVWNGMAAFPWSLVPHSQRGQLSIP
jgi:hypothetical protein